MKANELRIGNWVVGHDGKPHKVRPTSILAQSQFDIAEAIGCKPIPLTEEILLKCGFELGAYNWYMLMFKNKNIKINIKSNMLCIESYYDGEIKSSMQILGLEQKKLHQLQNLYFSLTGNELEIKL